jgi:hypothetical protein
MCDETLLTKHCCRNGAETWAECSGGEFGRTNLEQSQSFCLRRQASWLKVWRSGADDLVATERADKRNAGQIDAEKKQRGHKITCLY